MAEGKKNDRKISLPVLLCHYYQPHKLPFTPFLLLGLRIRLLLRTAICFSALLLQLLLFAAYRSCCCCRCRCCYFYFTLAAPAFGLSPFGSATSASPRKHSQRAGKDREIGVSLQGVVCDVALQQRYGAVL